MEFKELDPPPVCRPDPGPGQAELYFEDAGAVDLHHANDAGVGRG